MLNKNVFRERLSYLRKSSAVKQTALAEYLNIGKSAVSMLENGQRSPSADVLIALADYFDVSLDYLVGRSDDPARH